LDEEAVKAVKEWRFVPGAVDGQQVPMIVSIEMSFALRGKPRLRAPSSGSSPDAM
jgi:outer membrane biosynthesis protein TonB